MSAAPPEKSVPWQVSQYAKPAAGPGADFAAAPCWAGSLHPAGCPGAAWQSVALKHPGGVPAGAGGFGAAVELAPLVWHWAQTVAFSGFVVVWVRAALRQGAGEWGACTP